MMQMKMRTACLSYVIVGKKIIILIIISLYLKIEKLDNENNTKIEFISVFNQLDAQNFVSQ